MHYSVFLEPINEPDFSGHYYARIPTLDLTTHGQGLEGALAGGSGAGGVMDCREENAW